MSLKIFLNEMYIRPVNALRFNWKNMEQFNFNVSLYMRKYKKSVTFVSVKVLWVLSEKQSLRNHNSKNWHISDLSFAEWKKALSREVQLNWMFGKARHDCWFFCPGWIHYSNMNHGLYLLFHYLRNGTDYLKDYYLASDGHKKRLCFLSKYWLNSIF